MMMRVVLLLSVRHADHHLLAPRIVPLSSSRSEGSSLRALRKDYLNEVKAAADERLAHVEREWERLREEARPKIRRMEELAEDVETRMEVSRRGPGWSVLRYGLARQLPSAR